MKIRTNTHKLIYSSFFKDEIEDQPLVLIDAGARGEIEEPWKSVDPNILKIIGFEPDKEECDQLNKAGNNHTYLPTALWSRKGSIDLYITTSPGCSSVYNPNIEYIKKYEDKHWKTKIVEKTISCPTETLDAIVSDTNIRPDFLKIDTQGAEYDILLGSLQTLDNDICGVLLETWLVEVYKNQPTTEKIMEIMKQKGFELFDLNRAAAWKRKTSAPIGNHKKQIIGLDLLFYKVGKNSHCFDSYAKIIKVAALVELYGYPDYALEIIDYGHERFQEKKKELDTIKKIIILNSNKKRSLTDKVIRRLRRFILREHVFDYPPLHS